MTFFRRRHESILMTGMLSCEQSTACGYHVSNVTIGPFYMVLALMRESICFVVFKFFLLCFGSYGRY